MAKVEEKTKKGKFKSEFIIILIIIICVIILIFSGNITKTSESEVATSYEKTVENEIIKTLSKISGVGNVSVMLTFVGTSEKEFLTSSKSEEGGINSEEVVLISGKPYLLKETYPKIQSVVVVCEGADNLQVKNTISNMINMAFEVPYEKIQIYKMK